MANCTGNCGGSTVELLTDILNQDVATFIRLQQVVQAFETSNGQVQTDQGAFIPPDNACSQSELGLLALILEQRIANFNQLESVLLAV